MARASPEGQALGLLRRLDRVGAQAIEVEARLRPFAASSPAGTPTTPSSVPFSIRKSIASFFSGAKHSHEVRDLVLVAPLAASPSTSDRALVDARDLRLELAVAAVEQHQRIAGATAHHVAQIMLRAIVGGDLGADAERLLT